MNKIRLRLNTYILSTHILENRFPLLPGTNGIRASHYQPLGVDAEVLAISRLQGYPATVKKKKQPHSMGIQWAQYNGSFNKR